MNIYVETQKLVGLPFIIHDALLVICTFYNSISSQINDIFQMDWSLLRTSSFSFNSYTLEIMNASQPNGLVVPDATLHPVNSTSDVIELMRIGHANRAVGSTMLNERSSRSHRFIFMSHNLVTLFIMIILK